MTSLPFTFDDPVKPRGYDMESAIMRLTGYSQLGYPRPERPEFVHPEHTTPFTFIEPNIEPIHEPLPARDYEESPKRSYCVCRGIREVKMQNLKYGIRMICVTCKKVIRRNKSK